MSGAHQAEVAKCWMDVANSGGAVGFPFTPVDLETVDVDSLNDPSAFMEKFRQLWGGTPNHGLDYITRGTNFGTQHFFSPDAFGLATWLGPQ
jgi:hypothetical protein